jgi:ATP synthase subunit 6
MFLFILKNIKNTAFFLFDPLEQFDIFKILKFLSITNFTTFILSLLILLIITQKTKKKNSNFFFIVRNELFDFLNNIALSNISLKKQMFIILFYFIFLIILSSNIIGLFPFSFTITSSFILTYTCSFIFFLLINIFAIYHKGFLTFFSMFFPSGSPLQIAPLLILIEIVSYIARVFSLSIRLFANMMAGHTLLKILIGFSFLMLISSSFLISFSFLPWIIVTLIIILEILISMLQSYVYLILICIYTNDTISTH